MFRALTASLTSGPGVLRTSPLVLSRGRRGTGVQQPGDSSHCPTSVPSTSHSSPQSRISTKLNEPTFLLSRDLPSLSIPSGQYQPGMTGRGLSPSAAALGPPLWLEIHQCGHCQPAVGLSPVRKPRAHTVEGTGSDLWCVGSMHWLPWVQGCHWLPQASCSSGMNLVFENPAKSGLCSSFSCFFVPILHCNFSIVRCWETTAGLGSLSACFYQRF